MDIMKRNMEEYEEQLVKVFGSKVFRIVFVLSEFTLKQLIFRPR
jgi:hypothetical protein